MHLSVIFASFSSVLLGTIAFISAVSLPPTHIVIRDSSAKTTNKLTSQTKLPTPLIDAEAYIPKQHLHTYAHSCPAASLIPDERVRPDHCCLPPLLLARIEYRALPCDIPINLTQRLVFRRPCHTSSCIHASLPAYLLGTQLDNSLFSFFGLRRRQGYQKRNRYRQKKEETLHYISNTETKSKKKATRLHCRPFNRARSTTRLDYPGVTKKKKEGTSHQIK